MSDVRHLNGCSLIPPPKPIPLAPGLGIREKFLRSHEEALEWFKGIEMNTISPKSEGVWIKVYAIGFDGRKQQIEDICKATMFFEEEVARIKDHDWKLYLDASKGLGLN